MPQSDEAKDWVEETDRCIRKSILMRADLADRKEVPARETANMVHSLMVCDTSLVAMVANGRQIDESTKRIAPLELEVELLVVTAIEAAERRGVAPVSG